MRGRLRRRVLRHRALPAPGRSRRGG
jgi:hypothetical protein